MKSTVPQRPPQNLGDFTITPRVAGSLSQLKKAGSVKDHYKTIGPVYELLSAIYGGRSIRECRLAMLNVPHLSPGDRILFAGAGYGRDAIHAAELGAEVTIVDLSQTMLRQFRKQLTDREFRYPVRCIHGDILEVAEAERYDIVVANFFLNVFGEFMMVRVMQHLISLVKCGGTVVVGDFTDSGNNPLARAIQQAYWYIAVIVFWVSAGNAVHRIYDYPEYMRRLGLIVEDRRRFDRFGINCYWSIAGRKPEWKAG